MTAIETAKTYTIPVGPLHVALEEPMYFHIEVEGETVRDVDIRMDHSISMQMLFDPGHSLDERILSEQFGH